MSGREQVNVPNGFAASHEKLNETLARPSGSTLPTDVAHTSTFYSLILFLLLPVLLLGITLIPGFYFLRKILRWKTRRNYKFLWDNGDERAVVFAFFHPYCNAGGGGERVLWCAIKALQSRYQLVRIVVYTGDNDASSTDIIARVKERFGIVLSGPVQFIYLKHRSWVEASSWPRFTLLGQSMGSILLGFEALLRFTPDVCIDSMGYAFTIPLFRYLGGCRTGCYVHYPTISTDMLARVSSRETAFNNPAYISRSRVLSKFKLLYYQCFAYAYGLVGRCADVIMVNSSWTENHILNIWKAPNKTVIVYPPVDTKSLLRIPLGSPETEHYRKVVSIAQFRPEKNHALQIRAFRKFLLSIPQKDRKLYKLVLIGGCRNEDDSARVDRLMKLVEDVCLDDFVEFHLNLSYDELVHQLAGAAVGIHTMKQEHFGIGVVEFMAAGVIALAHNSGGPKMDIVLDFDGKRTGFLADDVDSYAETLRIIFAMSAKERQDIRKVGRLAVQERFSDQTFAKEFLTSTEYLVR